MKKLAIIVCACGLIFAGCQNKEVTGETTEPVAPQEEQMDPEMEGIVYPVFDRIYKLRSGPEEFYVYYEEGKTLAFPGREEDRE